MRLAVIVRDAGTGGGAEGQPPRCPLTGGAKVPFQFKELPWRNSELSEMLVRILRILRILLQKMQEMQSRIAVIAQSPGGANPLTSLSSNK